jgi:hypothetical protein
MNLVTAHSDRSATPLAAGFPACERQEPAANGVAKQCWVLSTACMSLIIASGCANAKQAPAPERKIAAPTTPLEGRTPDDAYGRPASVSQPSGTKADPARRTIPPDAQLVAGGAGELKYTAEANGALFLVDANSGRLFYRGRVSRGQNVKVDPATGVLQIQNKTVVKQLGGKAQQLKMFFQRD